MNPLIKTLIDIYGKVGDFRITPCDGAIPISEADRLAQEAVEQHNIAVAKAEREAIIEWLRERACVWATDSETADAIELWEGGFGK